MACRYIQDIAACLLISFNYGSDTLGAVVWYNFKREKEEARQKANKAEIKSQKVEKILNDNTTEVLEEDNRQENNIIYLHNIATMRPHQVKSIKWWPRINRFTQKISPNHTSLKLEVETIHNIDMDIISNSVTVAKIQVISGTRRTAVDNNNCLEKVP